MTRKELIAAINEHIEDSDEKVGKPFAKDLAQKLEDDFGILDAESVADDEEQDEDSEDEER